MIKEITNFTEINNQNKYKIATLGFFDGVHKGHRKLLDELIKNDCKKEEKVIITFKKKEKNLILKIEDKYNLLEEYTQGIDVLSLDLTAANILNTEPQKFIDFLKQLKIERLIVGNDYCFGKNAKGNVELLKKNFEVLIVPYELIGEFDKISSTEIKAMLQKGELNKALEQLTYDYYVKGIVKKGKQLGRTINFPTMNFEYQNCLLPKGVYKTRVIYKNSEYCGITNIGVNPTIDDMKIMKIETHVYEEFDKETYGETIKIEFLQYIRAEKKFNSLEELQNQIQEDLKIVKGVK